MTTTEPSDHIVLRAAETLIVVNAPIGERARIVYAGPDLPNVEPIELEHLAARTHAPGGPAQPIEASLLNAIGTGHPSPPGLLAHKDGQDWALDPRVIDVERDSELSVKVVTNDAATGLAIAHLLELSEDGVLSCTTRVTNGSDKDVTLDWCAALCLPLDPSLIDVTSFTGKWAGEFQIEQTQLSRGSFVRENRAGRTSHDCYPGLYFGTLSTTEKHGKACAVHLGWSGNHRLRADRLADDSISVQAGELLLPGEIILAPGAEYSTPALNVCWSNHGFGKLTHRLHNHALSRLPDAGTARPVHYNTWEAVYFDHSPEKLFALAEQAAEIGAERFVLDDGWFGARRNDAAGLGDWFVSRDIYPRGLEPLADHVRSLGMEFGLWFEPEMVNPDSDLFRAHPDWVLAASQADPIASRNQLPLDLTRPDVRDYLFERVSSLVAELGIAYIKWDMNRDIQHPGGASGQAVMHRQINALYGLIDRIRSAHPSLVIESCSSGGARADYGILARTDRVWTSDNNDARARHSIMRGASHFLPLQVLGNHVGPKKCHITGRRFGMSFRAGTAILGHMGMELDLAQESDADRDTLKQAIALHKRHRALIHTGAYHRLETPDHITGSGIADRERSEALFQIAILDQHSAPHPPRIRFAGLDLERHYRLACQWPTPLAKDIGIFAGSALMEYGLQLPQTYPDTCLIYHLEAEQ